MKIHTTREDYDSDIEITRGPFERFEYRQEYCLTEGWFLFEGEKYTFDGAFMYKNQVMPNSWCDLEIYNSKGEDMEESDLYNLFADELSDYFDRGL